MQLPECQNAKNCKLTELGYLTCLLNEQPMNLFNMHVNIYNSQN